jgi:hypothetical protein
MRQQHSSNSKSNHVSSRENAFEAFQMIMADSVEVMEYYYRGKIQELEQSLSHLNILENAREIASLCKDIIGIKEVLQTVIIKKAARCSIQPSIK